MQNQVLKTQYAIEKEAEEKAIYDEYNELLKMPGAMRTMVDEVIMKKYNIHSSSTIWNIRRRVEKRLKEANEVATNQN